MKLEHEAGAVAVGLGAGNISTMSKAINVMSKVMVTTTMVLTTMRIETQDFASLRG